MQDFKKLRVWAAAHRLALGIRSACSPAAFRTHPQLRSQLPRTAGAIAANIAEGCAKDGAEFGRYLKIALGATNELENHLLLARDAGLISARLSSSLLDQTDHVRRMLIRLIRAVEQKGA